MGNNLFGIGFGELLFIAILALIVFGPKRIPEVARTIGRLMRQLRQATGEVEDEMRRLVAGEGDPATWLEAASPPDRAALSSSRPASASSPPGTQGAKPSPSIAEESPEGGGDDTPAQDDGPATISPPLAG
jgi:sec-independent protein translocase protein TatB